MFFKNIRCLLLAFSVLACASQAFAGPNANTTVSIDLIPNGGAGNQRDDGVTSGTVSGQGTKIAVEVFAKGVTTPLPVVVIKFDFDASLLKVDKVENSAFSPILDDKGATFLALSPVTLPPSGFLARAEFSTVTDVTGRAFTLGIATISLHASSTSKDDVTTTDVISFNANNTNLSPDFDGNGVVGIPDFLQFTDHFGTSRGDAGYDAKYDLDSNGAIGIPDFLIFFDSFGKEVPPSGGGGGGSPDLIVESPSVSDRTLTTGQSFTLRATVRNRGTGPSASTTLRYYQSSDATISRSDTEVGTDSVNGLSASGTSAESISLNAPSSAGTYYYGACVNSVTGESDTNNNCSDAVAITVSSSSGGGGGGSNTYGVGESLPNFPSGFFVPAQVSKASLQFSQGRAVLGLQNGGLIKLQDGTTYTCIASGGCSVEGGRVTAGTIRVTTGSSGGGSSGGGGGSDGGGSSGSPDLVVESPSVSDSSPDAGEYFTLSVTVRNQGTGRTPLSLLTLDYYQSTDATISTSDTKVGWDFVSRLVAGETSDESDRVRAPSSPGTYYYGACVESVSGESNTNNNCSDAVTVTVGSPDLVVESPSVSDSSPDAGEYFTLSVTVRNQGTGRTPLSLLTLDYYQSTDATISTSDTKVGWDFVSRLVAGETSDESDRVRAPSSPGTYYYGACIESASGESDTTNNCSDGVRVTVKEGSGNGSSGGGTPPPSGDAVTGSITDCSSTQNGFIYNIRIAGTVRASRSVSNLLLQGYVGSSFVGVASLGSMSAGQSKNFTITGISGSQLSGRCRVEMTWLEGGNKSQGVVDEQ